MPETLFLCYFQDILEITVGETATTSSVPVRIMAASNQGSLFQSSFCSSILRALRSKVFSP